MEHTKNFENLPTPIKSENDKKEYRALRLRNGLEVLLISDAHSEIYTSHDQDKINERKAACALCIGVGSFSDPLEVPSISYFALHQVLFKEFEEYSLKCDFDTFIENFGGFYDAKVYDEHTTFYFDIQENVLDQALRHLGQFFLQPLNMDTFMQKSATLKKNFRTALYCDQYKNVPPLSSFIQTGHPANKITVEHLIKLYNNVDHMDHKKLYEALHKYAERHYSANRMKLVIQAGLSLDELENYVNAYFVDIPTNGLPPDDFSEFKNSVTFDTLAFRRMYQVQDFLKPKFHQLKITWVLPSQLDFYKSKPYEYVSRIINQEGKGSLISYLRKNKWSCAFSKHKLYCDSEHNSIYSLVKLKVGISLEGLRHLKKVLDAIFSFIDLLKREGPQKRIYDEFDQSEKNSFRYTDEEVPLDYVKNLCKNMHFYPSSHYLTGDKLYFEYNAEVITKYLSYLIPETVNIMISQKHLSGNKLDARSKIWYKDLDIPKHWIEDWKSIKPLPDFHLPLQNKFLLSNFSLITVPEKNSKYPKIFHKSRLMEVWYYLDPKLRVPKCYINLHLVSPLGLHSPANSALMDTYCDVLMFLLIEELYPATVAGIKYKISATEKGVTIKINGFNEKLPLLLMTIAKYIAKYPTLITEDLFEVAKRQQIETYYNTFRKDWNLVEY